jgi:2-oxoglutarate ferredoxin oxidoreductase subunit alpha
VWDAVARLDQSGIKLRAIQVKLLWPFPEQEIVSLIKPEHTLIVVECNYCGQLNNLLREVTGRCADHCIVKYNGRAMSGESVAESVLKIVSTQTGEREPRMVLHNDYE